MFRIKEFILNMYSPLGLSGKPLVLNMCKQKTTNVHVFYREILHLKVCISKQITEIYS